MLGLWPRLHDQFTLSAIDSRTETSIPPEWLQTLCRAASPERPQAGGPPMKEIACPTCRHSFSQIVIHAEPDRTVLKYVSRPVLSLRNFVNSLLIHCENASRGCTVVARVDVFQSGAHQMKCAYAPVVCAGCCQSVNRIELATHQLKCFGIQAELDDVDKVVRLQNNPGVDEITQTEDIEANFVNIDASVLQVEEGDIRSKDIKVDLQNGCQSQNLYNYDKADRHHNSLYLLNISLIKLVYALKIELASAQAELRLTRLQRTFLLVPRLERTNSSLFSFSFLLYGSICPSRINSSAFLVPYLVMYIFGGLPLFYLELALGQFQRSGCITVWKRICPMFSGIGFGICIIASYTAWYYNTIMAWSLFYMFDAMKPRLPWDSCDNWWNTPACVTAHEQFVNISTQDLHDVVPEMGLRNRTIRHFNDTGNASLVVYSSTEEYFYRRVLQIQRATGYNDVGPIRWEIALCLMAIFTIVYFSLWKGVKSSGKAVWVTATLPYVILSVLLVRGLTLEGSLTGIKYYLTPHFSSLLELSVWSDAASQIFFSLGPGFGVLLALSSYNKFHNNCYRDAMVTSFINCATSFLSGFVVFSVLGHMCFRMGKTMEAVANEGPGLVFIAYPEAIATLKGSTFWAIIFMLMLITLGLDSTFGGLEAIITAILDRIPSLRRKRELFVLLIIVYCFTGALATTTCGGYLILTLLDTHGAPISILFIVFCECVALCWFYGMKRFCSDIKMMLGFTPGIFWQICWTFISPLFLLGIFIANLAHYEFPPVSVLGKTYEAPTWVKVTAWCIVFSSLIFIPIMMLVQFLKAKGTLLQRLNYLITPEDRPVFSDQKQPDAIESQQMKTEAPLTSDK
ncbi:unnamed protein product [Dicrocoelium dendriticum]|nr:unnamed protein product [Dicrocoelium dendriticum]